jgi:hypothetical protein
MAEGIGQFMIKRAWSHVNGQASCQIAWTTEQLLRIEQAIEEGDDAFLATVEEAVRRALRAALTPPNS